MIRKIDLSHNEEIRKIFPILQQLRNHLTLDSLGQYLQKMKAEYYEMWAYEQGGKIVGLMGGRECTDFVRNTHFYIDDLVVDESARSKNIGAQLLEFAEQESKRRGLPSLRLACALANTGGMKFYERENWIKRSVNYVKSL